MTISSFIFNITKDAEVQYIFSCVAYEGANENKCILSRYILRNEAT